MAIIFLALVFLPETPRWLVEKGKLSSAEEVVKTNSPLRPVLNSPSPFCRSLLCLLPPPSRYSCHVPCSNGLLCGFRDRAAMCCNR